MKTIVLLFLMIQSIWGISPVDQPQDPFLLPWLIVSLVATVVMIWGMYRAWKSKNPQYGWLILAMGVLLVGLLFI